MTDTLEEIAIGHELADEAVRRCRRFINQTRYVTVHTHEGGKIVLIYGGLPPVVVDPSYPLLTLDRDMISFIIDMHYEAGRRAYLQEKGRR
jgi:hypothetical protein